MTSCKRCGAPLDEEAVHCPSCGASVLLMLLSDDTVPPPPATSKRVTWRVVLGMALIAAVIALVAAYI